MFQTPPREGPLGSWLLVVLWTLVIYATIPIARPLLKMVDRLWGADLLRWLSIAITVGAAGLAARYIYRQVPRLSGRRLAWLAAVVGVFLYLMLTKMKTPSEALHFLEYGLLGLLVWRALSHRVRDRWVYPCAVLVCMLVGMVDEILQWMMPGRFWDVRDILHNGIAALLAQLAVAGGMRPPFIHGGTSPRSVRWFFSLSAAFLILVGLCASNTPVAVDWYSGRLPALAFLRELDHPMSEYGYRYQTPETGRFYSRFRLEDLAWLDQRRAEDAGRVIAHYLAHETYANFLSRYTPVTDPFVHEAMVHLHRRNHYAGASGRYLGQEDLYRRHVTVAYRENQILERYFANTLAVSGQRWTEEMDVQFKPHLRTDRIYKSEVSRHLITQWSERQLWLVIASLLLLDLIWLLRKGREPVPLL